MSQQEVKKWPESSKLPWCTISRPSNSSKSHEAFHPYVVAPYPIATLALNHLRVKKVIQVVNQGSYPVLGFRGQLSSSIDGEARHSS